MHVSDAQLKILWEGLLTAKEYLLTAPITDANKQPLMKSVNESLSIIRNASGGNSKPTPTGGSTCAVTEKTKNLFEMWGLDKR